MATRCNLCASDKGQYRMSIQGHSLKECSDCGLSFLDPIPTMEDLEKMYTGQYYASLDSNHTGYSNYKKDVGLIALTAIQRYGMIISKIGPKDQIKLLDVGCAFGYYLDVARLYGWDVCGVDINKDAVREGVENLKLDIKQGILNDIHFPSENFDLVTCWDLIEHLQDPQALLSEANRILKVGGSLVLSTPDIGSLPAKIMGQRWMGFKSTEHIYFFSKKTLKQYLEKNGFAMKECTYVGKYISVDLFLNRLEYYFGALSGIVKAIKPLLPQRFYLNPFDILYIRAEKIQSLA